MHHFSRRAGFLPLFPVIAVLLLLPAANAVAAAISGTIYAGNNTLPNAAVTLADAGTLTQVGSTTTDINGAYSFTVANGAYNLSITPPEGSGIAPSSVNGIPVNGADVTQDIVLVQQAVTLSGVVFAPDATGISNVAVSAYDQSSAALAGSAVTDADGGYSIPLEKGTYFISLNGGTASGYGQSNVPLPPVLNGDGVVQNLVITDDLARNILLPVFTLSGSVKDNAGDPVANVAVTVPDTVQQAPVGSYTVNDDATVTDSSGKYSLPVVAGTNYSLTLVPPAASGLAQTVADGIVVADNLVANFVLQPAIVLSGVVTTPDGTGIRNVSVSAYSQASAALAGSALTDAGGNYSLSLNSGTYFLSIRAGVDFGYGSSNVSLPQKLFGNGIVQNLALAANAAQNIVLPLVTLSGTVTDGANPVASVAVNVPNTVQPGSVGSYTIAHETTTTDASGNYSIPLISGTNYSLMLAPPAGSGLAQTSVNGINATAPAVANVVLQPPVTLSGTVLTPGSTGVSNVYVAVYDQASAALEGSAVTDAGGAYSIPVASGTYSISVKAGTGYGLGGSNVPLPQMLFGDGIVQNLAVSSDTAQNIVLPLVTLGGTIIDTTAAPVGGVAVSLPYSKQVEAVGNYVISHEYATSDASGNYSMPLIAGSGYSLTIVPPSGSGLAQTVVGNLPVTRNSSLDVVLQKLYLLNIYKNGTGSGTVASTSPDSTINCGSVCSNPYPSGDVVTLTATPDAGSKFSGWSGACTGTGACSVTMSDAQHATATFDKSSAAPMIAASSPSGMNFGSVQLGASSKAGRMTIRNTGKSALTLDIGITGTNGAEFSQVNTCGAPVQPGGSCQIDVTFTPVLPYAKKVASLVINSNAKNRPTLVAKLSGILPAPVVSVAPRTVNFGRLPSGTATASKSVTVANHGLNDLIITDVAISGNNPGDFSVANSCGTVASGDTCTMTVSFTPLERDVTRRAALGISSNDPKNPLTNVTLSGYGK